MPNRTRTWRGFITGLTLPVFALASLAADAQESGEAGEQYEEVIVTGSYIKRKDSFDTANPINIVDSVDIAEQGVANMGDVIKNQTFNYGTVFGTNTTARIFQEGLASNANLRGLGSGATLTLINGRRTLTQNVNNLLPQIAIQRIETVKDGSSAIYGSDAVAGVVNFIADRNFEGVDVQAWTMVPQDSTGNYDEKQWQFKIGGGNETTHLVGALEYRQRGALRWRDRPDYNNKQYGQSATGNPGTWAVPGRIIDPADGTSVIAGRFNADDDGDGNPDVNPDTGLTYTPGGTFRQADPGCGIDPGPGGTDENNEKNNITGILTVDGGGSRCRLSFAEFWDFNTALDHWTGWASATHDFNDWLSFEGEFGFARSKATGRGSPSNPGGRFAELGPIPADHPGNPWRAFVDLDNDGVIDTGEHLFAQQAVDGTGALLFNSFGQPTPARDIDGDGVADVGAHGDPSNAIVLAANPFDPAGGVPFNEDVNAVGFRLQGKLPPIPTGHHPDGSGAAATSGTDLYTQWRGGLVFDIPDTDWSGEFFYSYQNHGRSDPENQAERFSAVEDGIYGRLGLNSDEYYNPFSTRLHPCVDRVCNAGVTTVDGDPGFISQFAMDEVSFKDNITFEEKLNVVDFVITGNIIDLPGGPLGVAFGGQWRRVNQDRDASGTGNACDRWVNACDFDYSLARTTHAVFTEFAVPILDHDTLGILDAQLAVRYEDSGGALNSTDPKIALRWQPTDWAAFRASWGSSFVAPALTTLFGAPASFLRPMSDRSCELDPICEPDEGTFRTETFSGNPDIGPETADTINVGFSLSLLEDDLTISFDWSDFQFEDRITRISGPQVIDQDFQAYQAFVNSGGTRAQWIDPNCAGKGAGGNCESDKIRRNIAGEIIEVFTSPVNANEMNWRGIDFGATYRFDAEEIGLGDRGTFSVGMTGTWVDTYTYKLTLDPDEVCPTDGGTRTESPPCEAAGFRNDTVPSIPPIPEIRINGRLGWNYGGHSATLIGRFTDEVREDSGDNRNPDNIDGEVIFDASYTYHFDDLFGTQSMITIGGINIFDTQTDPIFAFGGLETLLYDPRGALWYARVGVSL